MKITKFDVYNQITGKVIYTNLSGEKADSLIARDLLWCLRDCRSDRARELLGVGFPYRRKKVGDEGYPAKEKMIEAWTEFKKLNDIANDLG